VELRIIPVAGHWVAYERPDAFDAKLAELRRGSARAG
jgi:pimeloyl-ACP methyl ester carboxylesterase